LFLLILIISLYQPEYIIIIIIASLLLSTSNILFPNSIISIYLNCQISFSSIHIISITISSSFEESIHTLIPIAFYPMNPLNESSSHSTHITYSILSNSASLLMHSYDYLIMKTT
jgi:hypothetical protein